MRFWADWKEIRKKSKAEGFRARINRLEVRRRAIMAEQLKLTNLAELLEGTCEICNWGQHKGVPILSGSNLGRDLRKRSQDAIIEH